MVIDCRPKTSGNTLAVGLRLRDMPAGMMMNCWLFTRSTLPDARTWELARCPTGGDYSIMVHGNVYEWCQDWYEEPVEHVLRGGAYGYEPRFTDSSMRVMPRPI